jgi:hypothetical protein
VSIEEIDGQLVLAAEDRALIGSCLAQIGVEVAQQLHVGLVATAGVLAPHVFKVGGEAFIQPGLGPFAAGEQIAPPLVGQLVAHQGLDIVVEGRALVEHGLGGERGGGGVLHAAEDEVVHKDLAVAAVRVGDANPPGEEVDHLGRAREAAARVAFAALGRVVVDINPGFRRPVLSVP